MKQFFRYITSLLTLIIIATFSIAVFGFASGFAFGIAQKTLQLGSHIL